MINSKKQHSIPAGWSNVALSDVADPEKKWSFTGGPFGSNLKQSDYTKEGVRIIQLQNIGDGEFLDSYKIYTSPEKANELLSCNIYPGDIILAKMGDPVAQSCLIPDSTSRYLMASDGIRLSPASDKFSTKFVFYSLNSKRFKDAVNVVSTGSTRKRIGLSELKKMIIQAPDINEQQRIVKVLETWDGAIKKLEQTIALKRDVKKGLMQKLLTGKLRLPGFKKEWEHLTLGEIGRVSMCKRIFKEQTKEKGEIPFFKIGTFGKEPDAYISRDIYEEFKRKYQFPQKGEILISASGTIGRTVVYDGKPAYFQDSNIIWIANDEKKVLNSFLFYQYEIVTWLTASGTIARLYNDNVRSIRISVPELKEQEEIASILSVIDKAINLLEVKMSLLKEQKSYLLNNLVTGQIRTPENL